MWILENWELYGIVEQSDEEIQAGECNGKSTNNSFKQVLTCVLLFETLWHNLKLNQDLSIIFVIRSEPLKLP
jgi:hypothetical protein